MPLFVGGTDNRYKQLYNPEVMHIVDNLDKIMQKQISKTNTKTRNESIKIDLVLFFIFRISPLHPRKSPLSVVMLGSAHACTSMMTEPNRQRS